MSNKELINNIILNENAYFYVKHNTKFISKKSIELVLKDASEDKKGRFLLKEVQKEHEITEGKKAYSTIAVFKYERKPTFIEEKVTGWEEVKLAYICIVDFPTHLVVAKRNISGINDFINEFSPIDYEVLISLFTNDETTYEKFSMRNMNISDKSIRQKSLESTDLKENISALGLQTYTLSNLRLGNGFDKVSLSINSSRINKFGNKNSLDSFVLWADRIIDRIIGFVPKSNFLSSFATPQDYSSERDNLTPIAILISLSELFSDFEENRIQRCFIQLGEKERNIDLIKSLKTFERLLKVEEYQYNGRTAFKVINDLVNDLHVSLNAKSITLQSKKMNNLILEFDDDNFVTLPQYLNWRNSFIVTFDTPDLVYSNRKLFKDSRLLSSIDALLQIFTPFNELTNVTTEKGIFTQQSTNFSQNSIFEFVENQYLNDSEFFICDDMGREWADHIGLDNESVSFYHSKYKNSNFSASAFQDIIGQAQKNLGNLSPSDNQWPMKEGFWNNNYNNNGVQTNIHRVRKGGTAAEAVNYFRRLRVYPNLKKKVYLVVNFISKSELEDRLVRLADGEAFAERNEVIQILWFVSSLVSSCYEVGTEVYICCKP